MSARQSHHEVLRSCSKLSPGSLLTVLSLLCCHQSSPSPASSTLTPAPHQRDLHLRHLHHGPGEDRGRSARREAPVPLAGETWLLLTHSKMYWIHLNESESTKVLKVQNEQTVWETLSRIKICIGNSKMWNFQILTRLSLWLSEYCLFQVRGQIGRFEKLRQQDKEKHYNCLQT